MKSLFMGGAMLTIMGGGTEAQEDYRGRVVYEDIFGGLHDRMAGFKWVIHGTPAPMKDSDTGIVYNTVGVRCETLLSKEPEESAKLIVGLLPSGDSAGVYTNAHLEGSAMKAAAHAKDACRSDLAMKL
jgi:hypothetical protein